MNKVIMPAKSIEYIGVSDDAAYIAVPIESMELLADLINEARAFLYVGNTMRAMIALDKAKEEVIEDGD